MSKELSEKVNLAMGIEYKKETFEAFEGNPLSYYKAGSDSFAGVKPAEAGEWNRNNFGIYSQLDYDVNDALLLGVAARYEDYSDSGDNFSYKVNGRYKLGSKGALRASYSTGFRAPTLHQRHITNSQYIIVAGSSEPVLQGTLANNNPAVVALGVPNLTHEISKNIAAGFTYKFNSKFSASVDFYQIKVEDRVLFSSQISFDGDDTTTNPVEQILTANNVRGVQFFINAGDTKNTGADIVLNYRRIDFAGGLLNASFSANFNNVTIDKINTPSALAANGYDIFDRREQSLITSSRPQSKMILGLAFTKNKWDVSLNNSRFGEVTLASSDPTKDQVLSAKIATDLGFTYRLTDKININGNINNIFDVYPDESRADTGETGGGRFRYTSQVQQLGQLGTNYSLGFNYQF